MVALENAARVLPGDRGARFDLSPRDFGVVAGAKAPLGDEIVDSPFACLRISGVPFCTVEYLISARSFATNSTTAA